MCGLNISLGILELVSCAVRNALINAKYSKKPSRVQFASRFESSFVARINKYSRNPGPVTMRLERSSSFVFCLSEKEGLDELVRMSLKVRSRWLMSGQPSGQSSRFV